jgi:hypothetical protein
VLVVDDEACIRTFAERALAEARHGVVVDWKLECRTKSVRPLRSPCRHARHRPWLGSAAQPDPG